MDTPNDMMQKYLVWFLHALHNYIYIISEIYIYTVYIYTVYIYSIYIILYIYTYTGTYTVTTFKYTDFKIYEQVFRLRPERFSLAGRAI